MVMVISTISNNPFMGFLQKSGNCVSEMALLGSISLCKINLLPVLQDSEARPLKDAKTPRNVGRQPCC